MELLSVERRLTAILASDMVGYNRFMSADEFGMLFAIDNACGLMQARESVRSVVVFTEPKRSISSNN